MLPIKHLGVWILCILLLTATYIIFLQRDNEGFQGLGFGSAYNLQRASIRADYVPGVGSVPTAQGGSTTQANFWRLLAMEKAGGSSSPTGQSGSTNTTGNLIKAVMNPGAKDTFTVKFPNYISMYALAKYNYDPVAARWALLNTPGYDALQQELSTVVSDQEATQQFSADPLGSSCTNLRSAVMPLLTRLNTIQTGMTDLSGTELLAERLHDENIAIQGSLAAKCRATGSLTGSMSAACLRLATQDDTIVDSATGLLKPYSSVNSTLITKGADLQEQINSILQAYYVLNCPIPTPGDMSAEYGSMTSTFNTLLSADYLNNLGLIDTASLTYKLQTLSPYYVSANTIKFISRQLVAGKDYDTQLETTEDILSDISRITDNVISLTTVLPEGTQYDETTGTIRTCPAGFVCRRNENTPIVCPAGFYCPAGTTGSPLQCPNGTFSTVGAQSIAGCISTAPPGFYSIDGVQTICPAGMYCPSSTTAPVACPKGTYNEKKGKYLQSDCIACPAGTYCDRTGLTYPTPCPAGKTSATVGAQVSTTCKSCSPGTYCPSISSGVLPCPTGTYSSTSNAVKCTPCDPGTYLPGTGKSNLTTAINCPAGSYCPGGYGTPTPCPAGRYCAGTGLSTPGTACPAGYYCPPGTINPVPCPIGTYCPTPSLSATLPCPPGVYCPGTSGSIVPGSRGDMACPPGTYSLGGAGSGCIQCPAGSYCARSDALPTPCPTGTYNIYTNKTTPTDCIPCPAGSFCPNTTTLPQVCPAGRYSPGNATQCSPCPAGSFCSGGGSMPSICPVGTYCPSAAGSTALQCPIGGICPIPGATSSVSCPPGQYCPNVGLGSMGSLCPPGTFSGGGAGSSCTPCQAGTYSNNPGTTACTTCGLNTFSMPGSVSCGPSSPGYAVRSLTDPASMYICPVGTYTTTTNYVGQVCINCPVGQYNTNPGSTSCAPCPTMTVTIGTITLPAFESRNPQPTGLVIDSTGNLYLADKDNHRILKSTLGASGSWTTTVYAGTTSGGNTDGSLAQATFYSPVGMAIDSFGNIYVSSYNYHTIRMITPSGNISTIIGTTSGESGDIPSASSIGSSANSSTARIKWPLSMTVDSNNNIFVIDTSSKCIRKITKTGDTYTSTTFANDFNNPNGIACDSNGNVYVSDIGAYCVYKISPSGGTKTVFTGIKDSRGTGVTQLYRPSGIFIVGIMAYVFDTGQDPPPNGGAVIRTFNINSTSLPAVLTTVAGNSSAGDSNGVGNSARFRFTQDNNISNSFAVNKTTGMIYFTENGGVTDTYNGNRIRSMKLSNPQGTDLDPQASAILTSVCSSSSI